MRRVVIGLVVCCSVVCCGEPEVITVYSDKPVEFDGDGDRIDEVTLTLGELVDGDFVPLADSGLVNVIDGFQGGTWVHLSIRVSGLQPDGLIEASLGDLSDVRFGLRLTRTPSGFLEAYDIPLPVPLSLEDVDALDGQPVVVEASFESGGASVSARQEVVFAREVQ